MYIVIYSGQYHYGDINRQFCRDGDMINSNNAWDYAGIGV